MDLPDEEPPEERVELEPGAQIIFLAETDEEGEPLTGRLGGIRRADEICQYHAEAEGMSGSFKAILSRGEPLYEDHSFEEPIHAKNRLRLGRGPLVMYTTLQDYKVILDRSSDLWAKCGSSELDALTHNVQAQAVSTNLIWTGTDCEGSATYFHCNGWRGASGFAEADPDNMTSEQYYKSHQQLGNASVSKRPFADSFEAMIPCDQIGSIACVGE